MNYCCKRFIIGKHTRTESFYLLRLSDGSYCETPVLSNAFQFNSIDFDDVLLSLIADKGYSIFQVGRNI